MNEKKIKLKLPELLLALIIILALILQFNFISQMKQLPSPLYGGDYYAQLGAINHVRYGGSAFLTSNTLDELPPVYLPVYTWLVAKFANIFDIDSIKAVFYFSTIVMIFSIIIYYLLFYEIFGNKYLSIIGILLFLPSFPILKYTEFMSAFMIPLFLFLFYRFYKNPNYANAIFTGILFGLVSLTHGTGIIIVSSILFIFSFYYFIIKNFKNKRFELVDFKRDIKSDLKFYLIIFILGFLIALPYFYKPLFVLKGIPNYSLIWGTENVLELPIFMKFFLGTLKTTFFNFTSISKAISSVLSILGIIFLFALRKRSERTKFIIILLIANLLLLIHPLITGPLFKIHFVPAYMYRNISILSLAILNVFSLEVLKSISKLEKKKPALRQVTNEVNINLEIASFLLLFLLLSISQYNSHSERLGDRWSEVGKSEFSLIMAQASSWIISHTNVNDVILSNNENSFALNSLTGRKTLLNRRTHMSMFLDVDKNMIDAALMLYGNDSKKRTLLLKERKIKYLYWDVNWLRLEYTIQDNKIVNVFDPITLIYSEEKERILKENNISYVKMYTWLDPAAKGEEIIKQDIIYIFPYKFDEENPWNPDLNSHLKEVWNLKDQNNKSIAKIFEVT